MKKTISTLLMLVLVIAVSCQTEKNKTSLNLDFEQVGDSILVGWNKFGNPDYAIYLDSIDVQNGKYSAVIESKEGETNFEFRALALTLPSNYEGKQITLSGYIKTENVTDGHAGLWMRIDPEIAFDNMAKQGIRGTTAWTRYEITLPMNPSKTKQIIVGGLLVGKGKMWLDNLSLTIDGKDIAEAKIFEGKYLPAEKDNEFDKGSQIVFQELGQQQIVDLELLGKVWGFLKYHHPEVGKGNYNWDYELFRILPQYLEVKNNKERDEVLLNWINKYGEISPCKSCKKTSSDAFLKPDLLWAEKSDMNKDLKKKIKEIYSNRHQGKHFYIRMSPFVGNPEFLHENSYPDMEYPDAGFRLLALYKYWAMIQYFFPSTYLTDKDWNNILKEYIPLFIEAENRLEYELAALQIIGEVNDTHANLWGGGIEIIKSRGNKYAPFRAQFVEQKLVVTDYYNPELKQVAGLEIGDIITHINGKTVESIVDSLKKYYPASNEAARLRDISANLLRSNHDSLKIQYLSSGKSKEKELALYKRDSLNIYHWYKVDTTQKCYKFLDGNIGYVTLATIKDKDISVIKEIFKNTKGIIIDIRNYPSTPVVFSLGSYFVSESVPFVKFTRGNNNNPGEFVFTPAFSISKANETYQGKLVVIVNELTQSQAEYTTMAFKAGNATIVGTTTAGADGNVSEILLPGGLRTMISGIGVYYPDGTQTQRIGIIPDIKVEPTINGIKQGRDEVLERAIKVINK